ncbi:tyrosine-type recombinase/integrase [Micromonospora halotolerans]|uniref:Tyrosine-type recombinase/integrase n=1 Tax=Micromonospora halotolerans TaxID=709879 RepID=A0ABZ0A302_9ACTN|nr:tyrosine-type recombinase/integrase [Micromonospora halotolerans]WNM41929.1 tyrosine-type recombinase/integrase [Micromonospora halotolerans]
MRQAKERLAAGEVRSDLNLVFASTIGTAMEPRNVNRRFEQLRTAAALDWLHLHDLRHTFATFLCWWSPGDLNPKNAIMERRRCERSLTCCYLRSTSIARDLFAASAGPDVVPMILPVLSQPTPASQKIKTYVRLRRLLRLTCSFRRLAST